MPSGVELDAINRRGLANRNASINANAQNSTLGQYEGDLTQSPMYKRMYGQQVQDTTRAYNQARSARSARARMSGFGYTSPIAQTDAATVDQLEAGDLGRIGGDTMQRLMPFQMQAAGMRGQNIGTYTSEGTSAMGVQQRAEEFNRKQKSGMWSKLAGLGLMGASLIPGVGPAVSATMSAAGGGLLGGGK